MTPPPSHLGRLQRAFLLVALAALGLALPPILTAPELPLSVRAGVTLAALGLGAHWVRSAHRRRFAPVAEPVEFLVVLAILAAASSDHGLALFVVLLHALHGSLRASVARAIGYCAAIAALHAVRGSLDAEMVERALGLLLAGGLVPLLADAMRRYEDSERRLRSVVENSADAACTVTVDGRIRWSGASVVHITGREARELVGLPFTALLEPRDAPDAKVCLAEAAERTDGSATFTARLRHADGSRRWVEAAARNLLADPHVEGILLNLRDVTERHRLEAERRALREQRVRDDSLRMELEHLRERVEAQRERQELEVRLQRSQRLETVGQLAGGVAHDFNNLLAVILNYAGFIRDELPDDDDLAADLAEIENAARRGAGLTRQLLLFAQRKVDEPEVLDLDAVTAAMIGLLDRSLGAHVDLRFEPGPGPHLVEADPASLEQVVANLVVNARDALGAGGEIQVSTRVEEVGAADASAGDGSALSPGSYAVLTVADDGFGMDEDTLARALEPFFTTKEVGQGTGLGLATVYGVAARAGGGVRLRSAPGEGTSVEVLLPLTAKSAPEPARPASQDRPRGRGERILVVDDEAPVRGLVERLLARAGFRVVTADSGAQALARYEAEGPFDLVVTDITMPEMTGLELAKRLRVTRPQQAVLFMSGYSQELLMPGTAEQGPLLSKPFAAEALEAAAKSALAASSGAAAEGSGPVRTLSRVA